MNPKSQSERGCINHYGVIASPATKYSPVTIPYGMGRLPRSARGPCRNLVRHSSLQSTTLNQPCWSSTTSQTPDVARIGTNIKTTITPKSVRSPYQEPQKCNQPTNSSGLLEEDVFWLSSAGSTNAILDLTHQQHRERLALETLVR